MQNLPQKLLSRSIFLLPMLLFAIMTAQALANDFDAAYPKYMQWQTTTNNKELSDKLLLAYIKEFGIKSFMAMTLCLEASIDNKDGKTTALTTNFQHKEKMIVYWRNLYGKRAELGGKDFRGTELNTVNSIIGVAREYCPWSR